MGLDLEFQILYFLQELHNPWMDQLMVIITRLGDSGFIWVLAGILLFCFRKTRKLGTAVLLSVAAGYLVGNLLLKNIFVRPRPCWIDESVILLVENPNDYSFPSGHSLASFTAAVSICWFHRKWGYAAVTLASLIAFSRLYLFLHFPTDVIAGIMIGTAVAVLVCRVLQRYFKS